jgi:hypothetical protein
MVAFNVVTASGVTGTGNASLALPDMPYQCGEPSVGVASGSFGYAVGFTGLTGAIFPSLQGSPPNTEIKLYQWTSTGLAPIVHTNFTANTYMIGEVHCAKTH